MIYRSVATAESGESRKSTVTLHGFGLPAALIRDHADGGPPRAHDDAHMVQEFTLERLLAERVMGAGTVKRVDSMGCGVISPDEGDEDLVFQPASVAGGEPLSEGARVAFEVDVGLHGLEAFNVIRTPPG